MIPFSSVTTRPAPAPTFIYRPTEPYSPFPPGSSFLASLSWRLLVTVNPQQRPLPTPHTRTAHHHNLTTTPPCLMDTMSQHKTFDRLRRQRQPCLQTPPVKRLRAKRRWIQRKPQNWLPPGYHNLRLILLQKKNKRLK
jgi:hypothetical protein